MSEEVKNTEVKEEVKEEETPKIELSSAEAEALLKSRDEQFKARLKAENELADLKKKLGPVDSSKTDPPPKEKAENDAMLKSWEDKCARLEKEIKARDSAVVKSKVDNLVSSMASKIDNEVPELFRSMFKDRVKGKMGDDGQVKITCLDKNGDPSAITPDEMVKEILDNDKYKRYLINNRSTGSDVREENSVRQNPMPTGTPVADFDLSTARAEDIVAHIHKLRRL